MERRHVQLHPDGLACIVYGHRQTAAGVPLERGRAMAYERMGMVDAVAGLIDAGR